MFGRAAYEKHKRAAAARIRTMSAAGREIGELPAVKDPKRRKKASESLAYFAKVYFDQVFCLPWSDDHLKCISRIEEATTKGGLFALAMPRGSGKTSLCETATIWAAITGRREYTALIGASEAHAQKMLVNIKTALEKTDELVADFPELLWPVKCLEGLNQRAVAQIYQGRRTHLQWTATQIQLPMLAADIPGAAAVIRVAGLTGHLRGMQHTRPDGRKVRPSLVILDDPQTDESARSLAQTAERESLIAGAILGLAGPGTKIAAVMPCTIIERDDLADRLLDRERHPEWTGQKFPLVYEWPTDPTAGDHWSRYHEIRAGEFRTGGDGSAATDYYRDNRAVMDAGSRVAWPARHYSDELSALQHAYNLRFRNEPAFFAEYQNAPLREIQTDARDLEPKAIVERLNRIERGTVPADATFLTVGIDVQQNALFWLAAAWTPTFRGSIVSYGIWPEQRRGYVTLKQITNTLSRQHPEKGLEGSIYAGLSELGPLVAREWPRPDGSVMRPQLVLIDANWGRSTDTVYNFARQVQLGSMVMPAHGRYIAASATPMDLWRRKQGERAGPGWRIPPPALGRSVRHLAFDANRWKTFIADRLASPLGDPAAMTLYGGDADAHRLLADHLCSEAPTPVSARGRTIEEWKLRPDRLDNHFFDCLILAAVGASALGAQLTENAPPPKKQSLEPRRTLRRRSATQL